MKTWKATHKITYTPNGGSPQMWMVMLDDGRGYTEAEWATSSAADWERSSDGRWWFQGNPSPGLGTVTIDPM